MASHKPCESFCRPNSRKSSHLGSCCRSKHARKRRTFLPQPRQRCRVDHTKSVLPKILLRGEKHMFLATVLTLPPSHTGCLAFESILLRKKRRRGWHSLRVSVAREKTGILPRMFGKRSKKGFSVGCRTGKMLEFGMHV